MKFGLFLAIILAILLHVGFILFGGILFLDNKKDHGTLREVELLSEDDTKKKEEEKPKDPPPEDVKPEDEKPPDAAEILKNLDQPAPTDEPALQPLSLSAIEAALNGQAAGGDFASAMDITSGGRIGGTGKAGKLSDQLENAFNLNEIDQRPRVVFQSQPIYPGELRGKKIEGVVSVLFVVDSSGKVGNPRIEKSNNPAFEKPALEAVKRWKFEPAIKAGERVACKMRAPIRFQPS